MMTSTWAKEQLDSVKVTGTMHKLENRWSSSVKKWHYLEENNPKGNNNFAILTKIFESEIV